jgi:hypothetical protein
MKKYNEQKQVEILTEGNNNSLLNPASISTFCGHYNPYLEDIHDVEHYLPCMSVSYLLTWMFSHQIKLSNKHVGLSNQAGLDFIFFEIKLSSCQYRDYTLVLTSINLVVYFSFAHINTLPFQFADNLTLNKNSSGPKVFGVPTQTILLLFLMVFSYQNVVLLCFPSRPSIDK